MKTSRNVAVSTPQRFSKARVAAAKRGICAKTLFRWADAGYISRFKVGARTVLFDEGEIDNFIEQSRVSAAISPAALSFSASHDGKGQHERS